MKKSITVVDIAREAGVSVSTVSRVLTGNAKVSESKSIAIKKIIEKYNFHPNALARGLINTKSNMIGILAADIRNPYYSALFVSCENAALERGYNLTLFNSFSDRLKEFELIEKIAQQRVDALILLGGAPDDLVTDTEFADKINIISDSIPVLITGRLDGTNCTRININNQKAMSLVMEYISSHKHLKKVAFAGGSSRVYSTSILRSCYKNLLRQYGLEYIPEFDVQNNRYDDDGGYEAMNTILSNNTVPDVVIAINDFAAVGVMRSINEHNLRIPDDISIISFDDTYISTLVTPHLTSISYNYWAFGETIIENAIRLIDGKEVPPELLIEPKLIIRDSCR
ncbi:MAG: LacI family transcriptional regulator [Spirochaetia bacterium]|nr:LacI family transcriptional regulator [Spirochaetia bacterium]